MVNVVRVATVDEVCRAAAAEFVRVVREVSKTGGKHGDGCARVVLTGGGAGIGMLRLLVDADINWELVHVFFGDERNVAVTHPDSNEGQAREALLDHVNIPEANIHGYGLGNGVVLADAVDAYRLVVQDFAPEGFDVHLLGMGGEGHVNSLFPYSAATREESALVMAVTDSPKPPAERATLTFPAIARADRVRAANIPAYVREVERQAADSAQAAAQVVAGADRDEWPAAGARGMVDTVLFLADDAAGLL